MSLRVFLCHASQDKQAVRLLYSRLIDSGFSPWLDEEDLLPGQDWQHEIRKAVRSADVVAVCLSRSSISKSGFVQKEISFALDVADEQPDGTIFLIPIRLEECAVPERLQRWHWVDLYSENGYNRLLRSLEYRRDTKAVAEPPASTSAPRSAAGAPPPKPNWVEIRSPMVGTFYRAPSHGAPPYVEVGTRVRMGEVLCILEAMKLMNTLESEIAGTVREICLENSEPVEYGQVLFRIEPD